MSFAVCQKSIDRFTAAFMLDTFKVQVFALTSDGSGGQTQAWADETVGLAGYMEASKYRSVESLSGVHQQEERRWAITLESTTLDASRRLVQTHQNGTALTTTRTFKILFVIDGETFDLGVSCECIELPNVA